MKISNVSGSRHICLVLFLVIFLSGCAAVSQLTGIGSEKIIPEATPANYAERKETHGIVLLDVKWDRRWNCSGYENAQLRVIGFDRMPLQERSDDVPADAMLSNSAGVLSGRAAAFQSYALLLEPGEYALGGFLIRVAVSVSDIRYIPVGRSVLLRDGKASGGTFTVAAGEAVYIGNFFLDCSTQVPILWRYYTEKDDWPSHLQEYRTKYPFLVLDHVHYRLFDTEKFGRPYQIDLP